METQILILTYQECSARYGLSPAVFYAGAITLGQSLWRVALAQGLAVQVDLLPPEPSDGGDRRALAERLQGLINQHLQG